MNKPFCEKALREKLRKELHRQGNRGMPSKPAVALQQGYEDGLKIGKLRGQLEVLSSLRQLLEKKHNTAVALAAKEDDDEDMNYGRSIAFLELLVELDGERK